MCLGHTLDLRVLEADRRLPIQQIIATLLSESSRALVVTDQDVVQSVGEINAVDTKIKDNGCIEFSCKTSGC